MASKSVYIAVFVAAMMVTVTASAIIVATHEDKVTLEMVDNTKPGLGIELWSAVADDLNKDNYFEGCEWTANINGLTCKMPANSDIPVGLVIEATGYYISSETEKAGAKINAYFEPEDEGAMGDDPAVNYPSWILNTK